MTIAQATTPRSNRSKAGPPSEGRPHRAKRGEGDRLRDEILDATETLLIDTPDAERISVRAVADAVGRTPPSIYLHFSTKDELIQAVCERQFEAMTTVFEQALVGVEDPVEQIRVMARSYVQFALDHPEQYRILFMSGLAKRSGDVHDLADLKMTACFGLLVESITTAIDTGAFVPGDAGLVALAMWASVHGVASLLIAHDLEWPPLDVYLEQVIDQNLNGLLANA
jgi:AcrR family transcriptional regulator